MSLIVGFTGLTLLSYILIVLKIPFLIIPVLLLAIFYVFKRYYKNIKKEFLRIRPFNQKTILTIIVFVVGIAGQLAIISPSGIKNKNGDILFWSSNGHDGTWHIALMNEIKNGYQFQNPVFAGAKLTNYHFFSDILPAMVSKYTPISDLDLYFRVFPLTYSLFLGISAYFLTKKLTKLPNAPIWAVIFTYFAGSLGYLIGKGESVFWSTMPQSASGNPPQIISDFMILAAIYYVLTFLHKKTKFNFIAAFLLLGTISAFKIYAGVVILISVGIYSIWRVIKSKKFDLLLLTFLSGILALILYLPNSSGSNFLIFQPWWYIRTMIVEPSRLNLLDWELRRQTYIYEHNWKRVLWLEGLGFLIFFFGNSGMRFLGLRQFFKIHPILKICIILSLIFPLLFLQKGVASNTAQFLQYFVLLFGILAGIEVANLTSKYKILIPIVIILMVPTQITLFKDFYTADGHFPRTAFAMISSDEVKALNFIKQNTDQNSVIITPPYDKNLNTGQVQPPIWDWFDTSYVAAFSDRRTYFDDYEQVDIMGYDYKPREEVKKIIFESMDQIQVQYALKSTNANIIYFPKALAPKLDLNTLGFTKVYHNSEVEVWEK